MRRARPKLFLKGRSSRDRRRLLAVFLAVFAAGAPRGARGDCVPFAEQPKISEATTLVYRIALADVDGDGDSDVLSASLADDTIAWHERREAGWSVHLIATGADSAEDVGAADLDRDGDLDAFSASPGDDKIAWYENNGNGASWILHTVSTSGDQADAVAAADLDGDGDLDLASVSREDDKIAWYENLGTGAWSERFVSTAVATPRAIAIADLDHDGDSDLLAAGFHTLEQVWFENLAGGGLSWSAHTLTGGLFGATAVGVADVDGDGDPDALVATASGASRFVWLENDGSPNEGLWSVHTISTLSTQEAFATGDLDGDGDLDALLSGYNDDGIVWCESDGTPADGGWRQHTLASTALPTVSLALGDLDRDGDLDALSATPADNSIAWYRNERLHGAALFEPRTSVATGVDGPFALAAADLDGDGDVDLAAANFDGNSVVAWTSSSQGTVWTKRTVDGSAYGPTALTLADLDGDGDLDVAAASYQPSVYATALRWSENLAGDATAWGGHPIGAGVLNARSVSAGDVDRDGANDLLVVSTQSDALIWLENSGDGELWSTHTLATALFGAMDAAPADLDGDGDLDALFGSETSPIAVWYENLAPGDGSTWTAHGLDLDVSSVHHVAAHDLDRDGDLDALFTSLLDDAIIWSENLAPGDATSWSAHTLASSVSGVTWIDAADVDGDGDSDLLAAAGTADQLVWFENDGAAGGWTRHVLATGVDGASAVVAADLDRDGDLDALGSARFGDAIVRLTNRGTLVFAEGHETNESTACWSDATP